MNGSSYADSEPVISELTAGSPMPLRYGVNLSATHGGYVDFPKSIPATVHRTRAHWLILRLYNRQWRLTSPDPLNILEGELAPARPSLVTVAGRVRREQDIVHL